MVSHLLDLEPYCNLHKISMLELGLSTKNGCFLTEHLFCMAFTIDWLHLYDPPLFINHLKSYTSIPFYGY